MVVHFTIAVLIYMLTLSGSNKRKDHEQKYQQPPKETASPKIDVPDAPFDDVDEKNAFSENDDTLSDSPRSLPDSSSSWEESRARVEEQKSFCERLQKGSWVEVYSTSKEDWIHAIVKDIRIDSFGEKVLKLSYTIDGKPKYKEVEIPRHSRILRPSKAMERLAFPKVMGVLSHIPEDDLLDENSWEFTLERSGTELLKSIKQTTAIYVFEERPREKSRFDVLMFKHRTEDTWALAAIRAESPGKAEMILVSGDGRNIWDFPPKVDLDFLGRVRGEMYCERDYGNTYVRWPPAFDEELHQDYLATQIALDKEILVACCKVLSIRNENNKPPRH